MSRILCILILSLHAVGAVEQRDIELVESHRLFRWACDAIQHMDAELMSQMNADGSVPAYPEDKLKMVEEALLRAIALNPGQPGFHLTLGNLFWGSDQHSKTIHHLRIAHTLNPHDDSIASAFAAALAQGGEFDEAHKVVEWLRATKSEYYEARRDEIHDLMTQQDEPQGMP